MAIRFRCELRLHPKDSTETFLQPCKVILPSFSAQGTMSPAYRQVPMTDKLLLPSQSHSRFQRAGRAQYPADQALRLGSYYPDIHLDT